MEEISKASGTAVNIQIELFGQARILTGRRQVEIVMPEQAEPGDVVAALVKICPELLGKVIREDRSGLQESYTFNHNGTAFVSHERLHLKQGDSLLLFSSQAGG